MGVDRLVEAVAGVAPETGGGPAVAFGEQFAAHDAVAGAFQAEHLRGQARGDAATAMDAMLTALRNMGVSNDDMETRFFNIQPEYTYDQVFVTSEGGERFQRSERRLTGYRVTNTLSVTLRNLDSVGTTVDCPARARFTSQAIEPRKNGIAPT